MSDIGSRGLRALRAWPLSMALALGLAPGPLAAAGSQAVVAAAGDIACDPGDPFYNQGRGTAGACRMAATADLLAGLAAGEGLDAVLLLGDNQYEDGALYRYLTSYDPTWGRFRSITRPAPGNHEYATPGAAGYFAYFGAAAGRPGKSWYSFDLAGWHVVVLDSNCPEAGGCGPGSPQLRWLEADLAAHAGGCTLATWHHPRFSSGLHGDDPRTAPFWEALYRAGADVVLTGHEHDYERFAPQDPGGRSDPGRGLRQFVVGTGGRNLRPFATVRPNSEVRESGTFGVLKLVLRPGSYAWELLPAGGSAGGGFGPGAAAAGGLADLGAAAAGGGLVVDSGSAPCHGAGDGLALHDGRFAARVEWRDFSGGSGTGHPITQTAPGSGAFWFFSPDNWELMIKVLDGCKVNDRYWVFAAGLTTVGYDLVVTDTLTGAEVRYSNPLGRTSPAVTDTTAFHCP